MLIGATVKNCENNGKKRAIFATASKKCLSPKAKNPFCERQAEISIQNLKSVPAKIVTGLSVKAGAISRVLFLPFWHCQKGRMMAIYLALSLLTGSSPVNSGGSSLPALNLKYGPYLCQGLFGLAPRRDCLVSPLVKPARLFKDSSL